MEEVIIKKSPRVFLVRPKLYFHGLRCVLNSELVRMLKLNEYSPEFESKMLVKLYRDEKNMMFKFTMRPVTASGEIEAYPCGSGRWAFWFPKGTLEAAGLDYTKCKKNIVHLELRIDGKNRTVTFPISPLWKKEEQ